MDTPAQTLVLEALGQFADRHRARLLGEVRNVLLKLVEPITQRGVAEAIRKPAAIGFSDLAGIVGARLEPDGEGSEAPGQTLPFQGMRTLGGLGRRQRALREHLDRVDDGVTADDVAADVDILPGPEGDHP
jgi:hypothetical protein